MRKISSFLLFISFCLVGPICLANWNFVNTYDDVSIYKSKRNTRLTLMYKKNTFRNTRKIDEKFIKRLEKIKKDTLTQIGATQWQVDNTDIKKIKNLTQLTLSGSYIDPDDRKVHFKEYHFYNWKKKLQILITNKKKSSLKKDSTLKKIQQFRDQYEI